MSDDSLLADLISASRETGWAAGQVQRHMNPGVLWLVGSLIGAQARALGLAPAPNRLGEPAVSELRPTTEQDARPASLSAQVGLGEQPLHTDGAHQRRPPDYVILWCMETSPTPTRLWNPRASIARLDGRGVFVVRSGGETWLAPAWDGMELRFDPGCMTAADASARRLAATLQAPLPAEVKTVVWDSPGKVLLIRNRRMLHGRASVADGDLERKVSRVAYLVGSQ